LHLTPLTVSIRRDRQRRRSGAWAVSSARPAALAFQTVPGDRWSWITGAFQGGKMNTLFDTFKARAESASAEVHRFSGPDQATAFIRGLLQEEGVAEGPQPGALWAGPPLFQAPGLSGEVTREAAAGARVGISRMDWALADTGTLVQDATAVEQRLVSTLPPIHVALVASDRLLPDLAGVLGKIQPDRAGYVAMITGPSRTADIERVLTIGVHGPHRLIVVFVDDFERGNA
jgi:L-lactate dehydrogenase complex protein LldG